jgi:uncharacterized protein (TIGR02270 family)
MATSLRTFQIELYEEYLEEASFLYEQRRTLYANPEITWKQIGEFEKRLEAHIDGLIVGDKLALEVCERHVAEGDFGELFAALSVFCRQDQRERVLATLEQLDPGDVGKATAAADALKYELPELWFQGFITLLDGADPKLTPILAHAFGYRRAQCGPQLVSVTRRCAASVLPEIVRAVGCIGYKPASGLLLDYLRSENNSISAAAATALMRMGDRHAVDYCLGQAQFSTWPILPLGLAGGRRVLELLTELAVEKGGADCVTALGLIGDPISTPLLLSRLEQPETAAQAASALDCMTAAGLYETVFIPDEMDEDELFDSERGQPRQGKQLDRGDGRPFGSNVTRLSQNPEDWNRWWKKNSDRFAPGVRYRNGHPLSPGQLVSLLAAERTPHLLRRYCSEELVTRYGRDFGLETDMPVGRQIAVLSAAAVWSKASGHAFQEGASYFAGLPI